MLKVNHVWTLIKYDIYELNLSTTTLFLPRVSCATNCINRLIFCGGLTCKYRL